MHKETERLILLLKQRDEFMGLREDEYNELIVLLEKELVRTRNLDW